MDWFSGARARLQLLFARGAAESRMDSEIDFHLDMEAERLMREEGVSRDEAHRRARASFGGVTRYRETLREGRGTAWLGGFSLDMRLGLRMLRKYPGLTLVGGLAMAFAIWVGAVTFEVTTLFMHPTLPLPGGDRIVHIQNWDREAADADPRALHDFLIWRDALTSVTDLGAYRDVTRNLVLGAGERDADIREAVGAEVTASAFRIAPVRPLLGRVIGAADEQPAAPPVVVLGHDLWQSRFHGDSGVVGRGVQFGELRATVIGVMPDGFTFPVAHELWTQLRPEAHDRTPRSGPPITVFGRLAPGVSLDQAQAELAVIGGRMATEFPETHENLRPQVAPYTSMFWEPSGASVAIFGSVYVFALMLLVLVCSNVALLLFARAATREGELVVRSALGASRGRIVMQLFAEALVLGLVAAAVGLLAADLALRTWGVGFLELNVGRLPFWIDPRLSPATVCYALALMVLGAVIAGVLPALKITRGLGARLRQGTAGGGTVQFGGVWTAVIIAQVAVTVAFPSLVAVEQRELRRMQSFDVGFAADQYLGALLELDAPGGADADAAAAAAHGERYAAALDEMRRRMAAEPGVAGVTFVDQLPRLFHTERDVVVDSAPPHEVSTALIDPSYFDVLETPILAGRPFHAGDLAPDARVAIVDQAFVDQVLQGRNPIGRHLRFVELRRTDDDAVRPPEPSYEIVGVVKDLGMTFVAHQHRAAGVYLPADLAAAGPLYMVVHAPGDPMSLAPRVRELAAAVDPMLRIADLQRVGSVTDSLQWILKMWLRVSVLLTAVALLLSLSGIYSVLSFTVARRTREIGVRVALGASRGRLVAAIFRRPIIHVTIGVVTGGLLIALVAAALSGSEGNLARIEGGLSAANVALLLAYVTFMFGVCLLACVVPTRRALSVEPTEALRAE